MDRQARKLLKQFQCNYNRALEETFAQTLAEDERVRLFFINENRSFTDGRNIVVDPATGDLFTDSEAVRRAAEYLNVPPEAVADPWNVLRLVTRGLTIHECLHLLYTDFPGRHVSDPKCGTRVRKRVMGLISNIVEDAYIEAAGCSEFDNLDFWLRFIRVANLFSHKRDDGTVTRALREISLLPDTPEGGPDDEAERSEPLTDAEKAELLAEYLEHMACYLLYPMVVLPEPRPELAEFVSATKPLFLEGSAAPSPAERYEYCSRIFDWIEVLIPDVEDLPPMPRVEELLYGDKTHAGGSTPGEEVRRGRTQAVTTRPFTALDGSPRDLGDSGKLPAGLLKQLGKEKDAALASQQSGTETVSIPSADYDCAPVHKGITIVQTRPQINLNMRRAYQNVCREFGVNISSYNRIFQQLKAPVPVREEKQLFGSGIASRRLGDTKKRYWYRSLPAEDLPEMAVLLLIDGSGSMSGVRREAAMHAAIILHEVLKKQGIPHAVAEHRGCFDELEIDVNVLLGFCGREEEKYNLMLLSAHGDNRDGLALYWAERYLANNAQCDTRVIIVLSDGLPAHGYDDYYPPVSTRDTANAVRTITNRGTEVIAVSLDEPGAFDCHDSLAEIYPNLIGCNDLTRLPAQIVGIVAKVLKGRK